MAKKRRMISSSSSEQEDGDGKRKVSAGKSSKKRGEVSEGRLQKNPENVEIFPPQCQPCPCLPYQPWWHGLQAYLRATSSIADWRAQ